jgi:hypothetical protein
MDLKARIIHLVCFVVLATISIPALAQAGSNANELSSCRQFAQSFYSWYVPFTQQRLKHPASDVALQRKTAVFAPALLRALRADSQAQRRAKGELVGIDFDPFVASQDPADHYDTRKITVKDHKCFVEVWRNSPNDNSAKSGKPDVIAEISEQTGQWQFVNFRYPDLNSDLITILAALRKERGEQH